MSVMAGWKPCDTRGRCAGGVMMFGTRAYATAQPTGTLSREQYPLGSRAERAHEAVSHLLDLPAA